MRKLIASTFVSLDGIMQAPGGPEEDTSGHFAFGGWTFAFWDDAMDLSAAGFDGNNLELVLGRRTYEIFASYWPQQSDDNPIARTFNSTKKHVASKSLKSLTWNNSSLLGADVVSTLTALKAETGKNLQIIGSGDLIQTLQTESLIDEYHVWTYPVILGRGKRLFEPGVKPGALHLVESKVSTSGVIMSTYLPAGEIQVGLVG